MKTTLTNLRRGFTLVEMMVSLALAALIIPVVLSSYVSISTSLATAGKYRDMHHDARRALDVMRRDISSGTNVVSCTTNSQLRIITGTNSLDVVYNLSGTNLTRVASGSTVTLATGVLSVNFKPLEMVNGVLTNAVPVTDASVVDITLRMQSQGVRQTYTDVLQARVRLRGKL